MVINYSIDPSDAEYRQLRWGIYVNHKGGLYNVAKVVRDMTNGLDQVKVYYDAVVPDVSQPGPHSYVREFREFLFDWVHRDGTLCARIVSISYNCPHDHAVAVHRFAYVGPVFVPSMKLVDPWGGP